MDAATGSPVADIEIRIRGVGSQVQSVRTDETGCVVVDALDSAAVVEVVDPDWLEVRGTAAAHPAQSAHVSAADRVVEVLRMVTVRGRVVIEGEPTAATPAQTAVVGAVVAREPSEFMPDPARVGSATWVSNLMGEVPHARGTVSPDGSFEIRLPALAGLALAASAPGFAAASARIDGTTFGPDGHVTLALRRGLPVRVLVRDGAGRAIADADVIVASVVESRAGGFDPHVELLTGRAAGTGVGMTTSDNRGTWQRRYVRSGSTADDGSASVDVPTHGGETVVVVHRPGFRIFHRAEPYTATPEPLTIDLVEIRPEVEYYRLSYHGRMVTGSFVQLVPLFGSWSSIRFGESAGEDGRIAPDRIEPGRKYWVTVTIDGTTRQGSLTFGETSEIDVSHFR